MDDENGVEMFLRSWWSKTYNRPLKDPLLESYTLHELLYEYHDKAARRSASEEALEEETDKIELEEMDETMAWIEEEERKETESQKRDEDEKWMLAKLKEEHGDDFGSDINSDFSE